MSTAVVPLSEDIERVLLTGDLSKLTPDQRLSYYNRVCESLDLNPLTKPFLYLNLNGKTVLYASKDCTEQLRKKHSVSVKIAAREEAAGCYVVTAQAALPSGRCDESIGAVNIENLKGENRSNALMKAETKAKRRVTLSICGLGMLDESEVDSIPGAVPFEQGSKEAQQDVAQRRIKELSGMAHNTSTIPSSVAELDPSYEQRHTALILEANAALDEAQNTEPSKHTKPTRKRGAITFAALKAWGEIKKEILALSGTTDLYYKALSAGGYQHADEIKTQEDAAKIWKALKEITAELREEDKSGMPLTDEASEKL